MNSRSEKAAYLLFAWVVAEALGQAVLRIAFREAVSRLGRSSSELLNDLNHQLQFCV